MPNVLICCTFKASAMLVLLLLWKNTVDGFLCVEFRTVWCFPRCSIHCLIVIRFPVLLFHLNEQVNNMCRNRKTVLKRYSVAPLLAGADLHVSVFHEHVYGEHCMKTACTHFTHTVCKVYNQGTETRILNIVTGSS